VVNIEDRCMETTTVTATGVPQGYVWHRRELGKNGKRLRAAIANGNHKPNVCRRRRQLTESEARKEAQAITSVLGF
jgi:phosphoglycerate-specific signal transduction histidine kinase